MIAGTLELQMLANLARLSEDMAKAKGIVGDAVAGIEKILGALGVGFSAHALLEKIDSVAEGMAKLQDASEKTGSSVENLSKLQFFAGVSGSSIEGVTSALAKLSKGMSGAGNDTAAASQAFKFLGLSVKDASGNLKDPSILFGEISQKLIGYQDGAGKSALATALFGKSGSDLLPMLKKMAELGDVEASVTSAQAKAAEEYQIEVARLNQQKQILWNTVVSALLPTMQTFVGVLLEASKETGSLGDKAKGFAADKSIETWANSSAMGLARVVDVLKTIGQILSEVSAPFERIFLSAQSGYAAMGIMAGGGSVPEKIAAMNLLREDYAKRDAELKARLAGGSFWTAKLNTDMSDSVAAAIAARKNAGGAWSGPVDQYGQPTEKPANFAAGDATKAAAELKLYTSAMQRLELELGNLNQMTEYEKVNYELVRGSLKTLTLDHGAELLALARVIDARKQNTERIKAEYGAMIDRITVQEQADEAQGNFNSQQTLALKQRAFETDLIGRSSLEIAKLTKLREIDIAAVQAAGKLNAETDAAQIAGIYARAEAIKTKWIEAIDAARAKEKLWSTGVSAALDDYLDNVTSAANQSRTLFSNAFKEMEDALVNFVKTGKLDFKSLADSIISDLIRIQIQDSVTRPMATAMKEAGGIGGLWNIITGKQTGEVAPPWSLGGILPTDVLPQASGGDYMVNSPTLFLAGEAGTERATFTPAGQSRGDSNGPVFNVDMRGASVEAVSRLEQLVASVNGSIEKRALSVVNQARLRGAV